MICPQCNQEIANDAVYCGNCGTKLGAHQPNATAAKTTNPEVIPAHAAVTLATKNGNKAIISFACALLAFTGLLVPIIGVVLAIVALVFGTISFRSKKRVFAIIGMSLGVVALALSIFVWVQNAQEILDARNKTLKELNAITSITGENTWLATPCFSTKMPSALTLSREVGSCSFQAINSTDGTQYVVKVLPAQGLNESNLSENAYADARSTVSTISGAFITDKKLATFAGKTAYQVTIDANDGSAGVIDYIYEKTSQGNLVIVLHTEREGKNFDLSPLEQNWEWE